MLNIEYRIFAIPILYLMGLVGEIVCFTGGVNQKSFGTAGLMIYEH